MNGRMSHRWRLLRILTLLAVVTPAVVLAPTTARAAYCGITWGSQGKTATAPVASGQSSVTNVRAGRHACFDRLVIDLSGHRSTATVRYVNTVVMDGSGLPVPLRGGARLQIVVLAPAYDLNGHPTYVPENSRELVSVTGYRTFRQVAWAGSFEGQTTVGLGVRARLPMRVFLLTGPDRHSRVVIDVAHRW